MEASAEGLRCLGEVTEACPEKLKAGLEDTEAAMVTFEGHSQGNREDQQPSTEL
jgi:hypothetical protein